MSQYLGDYNPSAVLDFYFRTTQPSTGANFALGGTPALSVYKDNSTTQSTSGITLDVSFDSVTGLNHVRIDTSSDGAFYAAGSSFAVVITTGTVDSVSAVGSVVGFFTIGRTTALKPTTAGRTLDISAGGEAGIDWANIGSPTTTVALSGTTIDPSNIVSAVFAHTIDGETFEEHMIWNGAANFGECTVSGPGPFLYEYEDVLGNIVISATVSGGNRTVTLS